MELKVKLKIDGSFAHYAVKNEMNGIYIATLVEASYYTGHNYPRKIFLHKDEDGWKTDHHVKEVGLFIGQKIDEELQEDNLCLVP